MNAPAENRCPVCGGTAFADFRARKNVQCTSCRSLERGRLCWIALEHLGLLAKPAPEILHLAPEYGLFHRFAALFGDTYHPHDLEPERFTYAHGRVKKVDLCHDIERWTPGTFDLVVHNHVLEHLACDYWAVLKNLDRLVKPGGIHLFSVPFAGDLTDEDMDPAMPAGERTARFGQDDHLRLFGKVDFPAALRRLWNRDDVIFAFNAPDLREKAARAAIDMNSIDRLTGKTLFCKIKQG